MSAPHGAQASMGGAGGAALGIAVNENDDVQLSLLCRVCGNKNDNLIPIFQGDGLANNLAEKIHSYLPIKIDVNDALPAQLCHQCANRVISWHSFFQSCAETNAILNNKLSRLQSKLTNYQENNLHNAQNDKSRFSHYRLSFHSFDQNHSMKCVNLEELTEKKVDCLRYACEERNFSVLKEKNDEPEDPLNASDATLNNVNADIELNKLCNTNDLIDMLSKIYKRCKDSNFLFESSDETLQDLQKIIENRSYNVDVDDRDDVDSLELQEENVLVDEPELIESRKKKIKVVRTVYNCTICKKNLCSLNSYNLHMKIHSGEKTCICHICGKQFRIKSGLTRHLRETHKRIKNHCCETCGQKFLNKQTLTQHERIHTGERPFVCSVCGKRFKQSGSLHIHNKSHTDLYPFQCSTCDAKFRSKAQLTHHTYKHTGEKPNVCHVCGRAFRVKHDLNIHKRVHSDEKPFSCADCGLAFRQRRYLRKHNIKMHNTTAQE